ncbi:DUF222 domain-containing protein [Paenarthrobacter nitroguajacolicus]|uniref:DUF222 domain-containing protein n=1 Tax=Paenarthrobacter nitroguajacolicus TaxID=211146 RepID=UPI0040556DA3
MEGIRQILARRTGSSDAAAAPLRISSFSAEEPSRAAARNCTTTATDASADFSPNARLLLVPGSLSTPEKAHSASPTPEEAAPEEAPRAIATPVKNAPEKEPRTVSTGLRSSGAPAMVAALREGAAGRDLAVLLDEGKAFLDSARSSAADEARLLGFVEAADFAGRVEEISRSVEFLQLLAAHAVERTRQDAQHTAPGSSGAAPGWRTGWTEPAQGADGTSTASAPTAATHPTDTALPHAGTAQSAVGAGVGAGVGLGAGVGAGSGAGAHAGVGAGVLDDGYRDAAQFLRARLRISIGEARRRLALAPNVLAQAGMTGQDIPPRREALANALESALVPSRSASIISTALDKVQHLTDQDTITRMEHALTTTARESDPDFVTTMTKRWTDYLDQDGPEPTEETLRHHQGAFLRRRRRHGLHHLEIFATTEQYETLTTAMNTATNPRLTTSSGNEPGTTPGTGPVLDRRTRAQKLLNGLVGACAVAMTTEKLPTNGGLRPQLTVTIDERHLFTQLTKPNTPATPTTGPAPNPLNSATATFTGPIHPNTIRKIACDADIIPVLLGSDSRVLDIGRTTRIFPPHIRKAITARDQGCTFPDCTMPPPWCEAHHTTYWSHGGTTSTHNGTLLCSHHHHLIHKEQWTIDMTTGVPWFIPPPHIDPQQKPQRNHHHTPHRT